MQPRKRFPTHISGFPERGHRYVEHDMHMDKTLRIINEGVLSEDLAKRAKKPIQRGGAFVFYYQEPDEVSVWDSRKVVGREIDGKKITLPEFLGKKVYQNHLQVFAEVPENRIRNPSYTFPAPYSSESEVRRRIKPRHMVAIKLPTKADKPFVMKVIEAAAQKGIPVYDFNGNRLWPPVKTAKKK